MARVERGYNRATDVIMLAPGQQFGPFEIVETLGAGGMGHVYRARDPRLNRDVALKVIADGLPADAERVARFRREAQVLASLNHAHIGAIFGVEEADGTTALILELVDGPTLADRIAEGPLPVAEALTIARQIAEAIQAAHEQGILHRDLKPANIKLRPDGTVKVLDFGLAKTVVGDAAVAPQSASMSPTLTTPAMTGVGVILGTAAYMAPEQAKGKPLDKRADIWAFGCVLYETLTGRRAFEGEDVSDTLAAVLRGDPEWRSLPTTLAPALRAMLEGCLAKDRRDRIADFSTILFVLNKAPRLFEEQPSSTSGKSRRAWYAAGLAAAALAASAATGALMRRPPDKPPALARFSLPLPEGQTFTSTGRQSIAISPDGSALAYIANSRIFLRPIADIEPRAVAGTEVWGSIFNLTWSPDGQSLAFWASRDSSLKRISIAGGAAFTICPVATNPLGVSWTGADVLFSDFSGIQRVAADGGKPELVVPVGTGDDGGLVMYGPQQIADDAIMFTVASRAAATGVDRWDRARIVVHAPRSGQRRTIVEGGSDARYVSTGHLIYALSGVLFAAPFDRNRLETTGPGVPVIEGVLRTFAANSAPMHAALSSNGSLLYVPGPASLTGTQSSLGIADRKGAVELLKLSPAAFANPRVSPDGTRLAYQIDDDRQSNIWVYPLSGTSAAQQITFGGKNQYPVWSPDGLRIAFWSDRDGDAGLFSQPAAGGPAERLTRAEQNVAQVPTSWSPDGETLLFEATNGSAVSLWMMTMSDRKTVPFSDVRANNISIGATFSPDGRWVAYQTGGYAGDRTFVEPFPPTGTKHQIGRGGRPLWSRDGKELFFVPLPGQFSVVGITTRPAFSFTTPSSVPRAFPLADPTLQRPFDMTADGRFVVVTAGDAQVIGGMRRMELVLNWTHELARRVPVH